MDMKRGRARIAAPRFGPLLCYSSWLPLRHEGRRDRRCDPERRPSRYMDNHGVSFLLYSAK